MSCEFARRVLGGYHDGELDAVRTAEFERHLEHCPECFPELQIEESLRSSIERAKLYENVPVSLRKKIMSEVGAAPRIVVAPRRAMWRWVAAAAAFLLLAYGMWQVLASRRADSPESALVAQVIDAHLRSLQPGHLADVPSSDQHTVKPWFAGRLDFSPPVRDFAGSGFPLLGGRLDVVHGRTVAVLIYGRRKHLINVFVWPSSEPNSGPTSGAQLGYNWVRWRKDGMQMYAASDLNSAELYELHRLFQ